MDIKRLEQYGAIKKEIADLESRIDRLASSTKTRFVSDTVYSSSHCVPYAKRPISIIGVINTLSESKKEKMENMESFLEEQKSELESELEAIELFIAGINDSKVRQMIRYKYIDGLSWATVARKIYGYPKENTARMTVKRFLEKN